MYANCAEVKIGTVYGLQHYKFVTAYQLHPTRDVRGCCTTHHSLPIHSVPPR